MKDREIVLAAMAAGGSEAVFDPVQIQKFIFLIDREIPDWVNGPHFDFKPYHYGPFDKTLYDVLGALADGDWVAIDRTGQYPKYVLTTSGLKEGRSLLAPLPGPVVRYLARASSWVRLMTFRQLLAAIYDHYPDMAANSIVRQDMFRRQTRSKSWTIPSLLNGAARTLDFGGRLTSYPQRWTHVRNDARAIKQDWEVVGEDLEGAMGACYRSQISES